MPEETIIKKVADALRAECECDHAYFKKHTVMVPSRPEVIKIIKKIQHLMFPDYFRLSEDEGKSREQVLEEVFLLLKVQLTASYSFFDEDTVVDTESIAYEIIELLPSIKCRLLKDVMALYEGDPAARSPEEIILSYPGFYAISIYRIAHEFYVRKIPYISKEIFEPLGMTDTTFIPTEEQWSRFIPMHTRTEVDGVGISGDGPTHPGSIFENFPLTWFSGGAGLCSTLPDYVKFAEMLLNEGRLPDGTQLVPAELIRDMATPCVPFEIMPARERWGLGVRVITEEHWMPKTCFGWSGAYGSHFWVDPVNKITAVYMKNSRYDGGAGSQTSGHFEQDVYASLE